MTYINQIKSRPRTVGEADDHWRQYQAGVFLSLPSMRKTIVITHEPVLYKMGDGWEFNCTHANTETQDFGMPESFDAEVCTDCNLWYNDAEDAWQK